MPYDPKTGAFTNQPRTPWEQGVIPTDRQGKKGLFSYGAPVDELANLGGYDPKEQARLEAETYQRLNSGPQEPTTSQLVGQTYDTLLDTAPTAYKLAGMPTGMQTSEMYAPEPDYSYDDAIMAASRAAQIGGSVAAPFTGGATLPIAALGSVYPAARQVGNMAQDIEEKDLWGLYGHAALAGLEASPMAALGRTGQAVGGPIRPQPGMNWTARNPAGSSTITQPRGHLPGQTPLGDLGDPRNLWRETQGSKVGPMSGGRGATVESAPPTNMAREWMMGQKFGPNAPKPTPPPQPPSPYIPDDSIQNQLLRASANQRSTAIPTGPSMDQGPADLAYQELLKLFGGRGK